MTIDQNSVFQQSIKKHGLNWFFIDWVFLCVCLCVETIIFWLPFKWFDGRWRNERFFVCFLWWKTLSYSLTGGNMSPVNSFAIQSNSSLVEYYEVTMFENDTKYPYLCVPFCTFLYLFVPFVPFPFCTFLYPYVPLCTFGYLCVPLCTFVYLCVPFCTGCPSKFGKG